MNDADPHMLIIHCRVRPVEGWPWTQRKKQLFKALLRAWGLVIEGHEEGHMSTFLNGPAADVSLVIRRAPLYLRAVQSAKKGEWDALDQLNDEPKPKEKVFAYRKIRDVMKGFMDGQTKGGGRRTGTYFEHGEYVFVEPQPNDEIMRSREKWQEWCFQQVAKEKDNGEKDEAARSESP